MGRVKRVYYNNAVYHVTIRGNNKQAVLKNDTDKDALLSTLSKYRLRFGFKLFGFILMDNHAHLIIAVNSLINISKIMQAIALSYSQKFRRKYKYTGYVWQGRFRSNIIESDVYILKCLEYIHNNPVRAGIVDKPQDYKWSSYHFYYKNDNPLAGLIEIDNFSL